MKQIATEGKVVRSSGRGQAGEHGTKSVKVGCGLECHWGSGSLRARVIAFLNDGAGLTGIVRRLFGRER